MEFQAEPYGNKISKGETGKEGKIIKYLGDKRVDRNPFNRQHSYIISCPQLKDLLEYQGNSPSPGKCLG
jgi:hypothetical protein